MYEIEFGRIPFKLAEQVPYNTTKIDIRLISIKSIFIFRNNYILSILRFPCQYNQVYTLSKYHAYCEPHINQIMSDE